MNIKKVFCFFEQSGTFKKEFIRLGIPAEDFDIANDYGETDRIIDLFAEIDKAFDGLPSVFDEIEGGDLIFAFFPCIRFNKLYLMHMNQTAKQYKNYTDLEKAENAIRMQSELSRFYVLISKFVAVCLKRKIPLIIENPYSADHYLVRYWPFLPKVIDMNRREMGDYFEKPTQFYFFNLEPCENLLFDEPIDYYPKRRILNLPQREKSEISPGYARRFIRRYLLHG